MRLILQFLYFYQIFFILIAFFLCRGKWMTFKECSTLLVLCLTTHSYKYTCVECPKLLHTNLPNLWCSFLFHLLFVLLTTFTAIIKIANLCISSDGHATCFEILATENFANTFVERKLPFQLLLHFHMRLYLRIAHRIDESNAVSVFAMGTIFNCQFYEKHVYLLQTIWRPQTHKNWPMTFHPCI